MKRENNINNFINIIDFDEAIQEWRKNKKTLKNGMFSYKKCRRNCNHNDNGIKCRKKQIIDSIYCENHFN